MRIYFLHLLHSDAHGESTPDQAIQAMRETLIPFGVDFSVFHFADLLNAKE